MARLILLVFLLVGVSLAIAALAYAWRTITTPAAPGSEDRMPDTFRNIAYLLLLILLFGITMGWLGG